MPLYVPSDNEINHLRRSSYPDAKIPESASSSSFASGTLACQCRCRGTQNQDSAGTSEIIQGMVNLSNEFEASFKRVHAMLVNERRRRYNERKMDRKVLKPLVKERPGSGFNLAIRCLGVDPQTLSPVLDDGPDVGDEYPTGMWPDPSRLTLHDLCSLVCFYNEDFGIDAEDWGRDAFCSKFVEWLKV